MDANYKLLVNNSNISTEFCINKNNIFIFTHYKQYRTFILSLQKKKLRNKV